MNRYSSVYSKAIGQAPVPSLQKRLVFETLAPACASPLELLIFLQRNPEICRIISDNYDKDEAWRDVSIIMIAWMLKNRKNFLKETYPLEFAELERIALAFGEAYPG